MKAVDIKPILDDCRIFYEVDERIHPASSSVVRVKIRDTTLNRWRRLQRQADMLQRELGRAIQKEVPK